MEYAIAFGTALEAVALFLSLGLAVNLTVYGWLGASGVFSGKEANRGERLIYSSSPAPSRPWRLGVFALAFEVHQFA